jgi:hypothetical protein
MAKTNKKIDSVEPEKTENMTPPATPLVANPEPKKEGQQSIAEPSTVHAVHASLLASTAPAPAPDPDPFDLNNLRLDQSFVETAGVEKLLTTVPVTKPHDQEWFRVHPDPAYRETLAMIHLKDDREYFLLTPQIAKALPGEFIMVHLYTVMTRQGTLFLWPIKLPGADEKIGTWYTSAVDAADYAIKHWTKIKWNKKLMAYEKFAAPRCVVNPEWPKLSYNEILRIAFRDRFVDKLDHPVIKALHCAT